MDAFPFPKKREREGDEQKHAIHLCFGFHKMDETQEKGAD